MFGNVDLTATPPSSSRRRPREEGHPSEAEQLNHQMSCIHHTLQIICNILHIGLMVSGLFIFIYGIMISFHKPDPQKAMGSILELYASALLLASILGIYGTYRTSCRRIPLQISYRLVPAISILNIAIILILIIEKHSFLRYLDEKQEELFLSSEDVQYIKVHFNIIYHILILFTVLEMGRFYVTRQLWKHCQQLDYNVRQEEHYRRSRDLQESRRRWNAERNGNHIDDDDEEEGYGGGDSLTSPLLDKTNDSSTRENPANAAASISNTSWWEDPEDAVQDDMNVSSTSSSWSLSRMLFHRKKQLEDEDIPSTPLESSHHVHDSNEIQQDSIDQFADVDEEIIYPDIDIPLSISDPLQTSDASDGKGDNDDNPQTPASN